MAERIQKVLARAGYGSRREIENKIQSGLVEVNGKAAQLGQQISEQDQLKLDGHLLSAQRLWRVAHQVLLYHKPVGEVCTRRDPEKRRTIFQALPTPEHGRWVSVGRLDINTSGLLILTTDGELANRLMHPSNAMDREYAVRVLGQVSDDQLATLREGVMLEDGMARFHDIQASGGSGANHWYHVVIQEGRNREVRRLWESQDLQVSRLMRVRYGPIIMPNKLRAGRWMYADQTLIQALYESVALSRTTTAAPIMTKNKALIKKRHQQSRPGNHKPRIRGH